MLGHRECSNSAEAEAETYSSTITSSSTTTTTTIGVARNKKKSKNRRRFSDEQIKSLELMFETEWRLEPRKKAEAARELGLQPRQVAIWFQNKRARWKAKQLLRDFNALRANYSALASRFEALKKEKNALLIQLQKLNDPVQQPGDQSGCCREVKLSANNSIDRESDNGETMKCEAEVRPSPSMERSDQVLRVLSDEDSSMKAEFFGRQGQPNLLNFDDQNGDASLASPEDWGRFESDDMLGQSGGGYQWWDFWS